MGELIPSEFLLSQNYPNPFKEKTIIKYCIAYKSRVQLAVYNTAGELIKKLVDEEKQPGTYEVEFDASTCHPGENLPDGKAGRDLPGGNYKYLLVAGHYSNEKTMFLDK
jgi:hypothetical protein